MREREIKKEGRKGVEAERDIEKKEREREAERKG